MDTNAKKLVYGRVGNYTEYIVNIMRNYPHVSYGEPAYEILTHAFANWLFDTRHHWTGFVEVDQFELYMYETLLCESRIREDDVEAKYEELAEEEEAADDEN